MDVVGAIDGIAAYPVDRPVSAGDMVATIYQSLGIGPDSTNQRLQRPTHADRSWRRAVWEAIA